MAARKKWQKTTLQMVWLSVLYAFIAGSQLVSLADGSAQYPVMSWVLVAISVVLVVAMVFARIWAGKHPPTG
ncbi:hypothetical protein ABH924_001284 [Arthrobacter sp. GAS37]|uniref:hypothetical protein n=1 Tax=Arthrobacter sp. GAS37 TaxID=3156261 RepID=UPI003838129E